MASALLEVPVACRGRCHGGGKKRVAKQCWRKRGIVHNAHGKHWSLSGAACRADTRNALEAIMAAQPDDPACVLRVADDFLFGFSHALLAWAFAVSAQAAQQQPDDEFARGKLDKMRYGLNWILPQASVHWERVVDGVQGLTLPAA